MITKPDLGQARHDGHCARYVESNRRDDAVHRRERLSTYRALAGTDDSFAVTKEVHA